MRCGVKLAIELPYCYCFGVDYTHLHSVLSFSLVKAWKTNEMQGGGDRRRQEKMEKEREKGRVKGEEKEKKRSKNKYQVSFYYPNFFSLAQEKGILILMFLQIRFLKRFSLLPLPKLNHLGDFGEHFSGSSE